MKNGESLAKFGKKFQENLVYLVLTERVFADQMQELLDSNFLELRYLQVFVDKIFRYREKYDTHPSIDGMAAIVRTELENEDDVVQKQVRDYYSRALANGKVQDVKFIKDVAIEFCKKQKLKEAILKSVDLLNNASYDEIKVLIDEAIKLGSETNHGYDYIVDFEERYATVARDPISTGWLPIDQICEGGLGKKELGVIISYTGGGKSMVLVHLGAMALKAGKNVIHYTLELQDKAVGKRYDSCITRIPINSLPDYKQNVFSDISQLDGKLVIKEYPSRSVTTTTLRAHLDKTIKDGFPVDVIIVDYPDLLRGRKSYKEKRQELEEIYEELRAMAQEYACVMWVASQCNRGGLNNELITMDAISEAYNKCFPADFIMSLSRTIEDKGSNEGRFFIAKNRMGQDYDIFPIKMDTSNVNISVGYASDETIKEVKDNAVKKQQRRLQEEYKKFKEESG